MSGSGRTLTVMLRAGLLLILLAAADACSVPVFAYALRRWQPDLHVLTTARDLAWRAALDRRVASAGLNLAIEAGGDAEGLSHRAIPGSWWTGNLSEDRVDRLLVSPLRRELARRLVAGHTAVWLFVPGGDAAADAAARTLVEARLAYLTRSMSLPGSDAGDLGAVATLQVAAPAVRLEFSVLDLARDDAAEWVLNAQVQAMAPQAKGPCVIPVFGRARALEILHGDTLVEAMIDDVVRFLCGSCSCQVKEQNPGWDLLVACDWVQELERAAAAETALQPVRPQVDPLGPETVIIRPRSGGPPVASPRAIPQP